MSWLSARQAIRDRFLAAWAGATRVVLENEPFDPSEAPLDDSYSPVPWVYLEILENGSETAGFGQKGANTIRYHGLVLIHVFVPLDTGADYAMQLAEQGSNVFLNQAFSGVQMWTPTPPSPVFRNEQMGGRSADGNWWHCYTSVPFQYDFQG